MSCATNASELWCFVKKSYVAPEVLLRKEYGMKVDIWTIGIICYLMLGGFLPFDHPSEEKEIIRQTLDDDVPFPRTIWDKYSSDVKTFVKSNFVSRSFVKRY